MQSLLRPGEVYLIVELDYIRARYIRLQFFPGDNLKKYNLNTRFYRFETLNGDCWTIPEQSLLQNVRTLKGYSLIF